MPPKYVFPTCVICGHQHGPVFTCRLILHVHVATLVQVRGAALPAAGPTAEARSLKTSGILSLIQ